MYNYGLVLLLACTYAAAQIRPRLDGRIIGGHRVDIEEYPHQLSLQSYGSHICGASIISEDWVLTASHCVDGAYPSEITFRAGSSIRGQGGSIHRAEDIVMHPNYDNLDWDYALVKVRDPFPLGEDGIEAISLASEEPSKNTLVTVTGWGVTDSGSLPRNLQAVYVFVVSRSSCNAAYGDITKRMICAADYDKDACQGDSGGPLIDPMTREQVGVVSWGKGCAEDGYPGVYSNVAAVRDWITKISGV